MENCSNIISCALNGDDDDNDDDDENDDDNDVDDDDDDDTFDRSGGASISIDDYEGLFHELTSDQIDNSVAAFLTRFDSTTGSRSASPQNIEFDHTYILATDDDHHPPTSNGATTPDTVATTTTTITTEEMEKVDEPIRKTTEIQDRSKQQLHHKERELKCKRRLCRVDGCERTVKSQGVCQRHGAKTKVCRMPHCNKQAQGNFDGMCKAHYKIIRRMGEHDPLIPLDNNDILPEDHFIGSHIVETNDYVHTTQNNQHHSRHQDIPFPAEDDSMDPNDNLNESIAVTTDFYHNKQCDLQDSQHSPPILLPPPPPHHQMFYNPMLLPPLSAVPTPARPFYLFQPSSYPQMPYQESLHTSSLPASYIGHCIPVNVDTSTFHNQYVNYTNHTVPPTVQHIVPPQHAIVQQQNYCPSMHSTNDGWGYPYINQSLPSSLPNIMMHDRQTNMNTVIPTLVTNNGVSTSTDSCAVVSVLDATAISDTSHGDEPPATLELDRYSNGCFMNKALSNHFTNY